MGAAAKCYCLCGPAELDGIELALGAALAELSGNGLPVLLICRPKILAYFEPEYESGAGQRYILNRTEAEQGAPTKSGDSN